MTGLQNNSEIEKIQIQVNDVKDQLERLKKETDQSTKEQKTQVIEGNIISTKQKINAELQKLEESGESGHQNEIRRLQEMLVNLDGFNSEIYQLKSLVIQQRDSGIANLEISESNENQTQGTNIQQNTQETGSWFRRQRNGVTDKKERKENRFTNIARIAGGIGAISLAVRGVKKLFGFGKEKKERGDKGGSEKKKSWRKKALLWGGGILGGAMVWKNWDWILNKFGLNKKLSFEDSLLAVKGDLNNISEWQLKARLNELIYDQSSKEIRSYGEGTKIDKNKKKIEGLDTNFSDYKQLIFVANFINYIKSEFKGKGANSSPFFSGNIGGDLYIRQGAHISGNPRDVEVISGGMWSTLRRHAPDIDPSATKRLLGITGLVDTNGKNKLVAYLNSMDIWEKGDAPLQANPENDPVITQANQLQQKIHETAIELNHRRTRGTIEAIKVSDFEYDIKSQGFKQKILFKPEIKIEGMNIVFPTEKEAMSTANLINKMKNNNHGLCENSSPFSFEREYGKRGLYVNRKSEGPITNPTRWRKIRVLKESTLKSEYPTIYQKNNRQIFLDFLNNLPSDGEFRSWIG